MIQVIDHEDGRFTISWDPNDPTENVLSQYTSEEIIKVICDYAEKTLEESRKTYYIDQTAEEVEQDIDTLRQFTETTEEDWKDFWGSDYHQKQ